MKTRIGILTGGGDCPGLNAAIKSVVKSALNGMFSRRRKTDFDVIGIRDGWKGLCESAIDTEEMYKKHIMPLYEDLIRSWDLLGGTMLGTSRTNPFNPAGDRSALLLSNIEKLSIDCLVAIGGEDTLGVAQRLQRMGVRTVGIPKTIDRDLVGTDYTLGFESAVQVITEEVDRLRTTAGSHNRIFVVETMGRHSGWLALEGGESSGACVVLLPECDFEIERVNGILAKERSRGARHDIVVVAEGAKPKDKDHFVKSRELDSFGHCTLGGIGEYLACEIQKGTGIETRSLSLSYLQRGGLPCAYDRRMGKYFGTAAVDLIVRGDFGKMVSYRNGRITAVPLEEIVGKINTVNVDTYYDTERYNGSRTLFLDEPLPGNAKG